MIQSATALAAEEDGGTLTTANALGLDLAQAWERLTRDTRAAFPSPAQRRAPDVLAYSLTETCGEVYSIGAYRADTLPGRALLCNYYFNFPPPILRFTGPTTHRSKQEKIPQGANELKFGFRA
jgi:hypothetical protein